MLAEDEITMVPTPYAETPVGFTEDIYQMGTELTSMSLEKMRANPWKFARDNPKSFDWVFENVMR